MKFEKILITGGSRGIGKALVDIFLNDNCEVHVVARSFSNQPSDSNLKFHTLDLTETDKITSFCDDFISKYGIPDLLINNAGSGAFYEWNCFPEKEIINQINLLFTSPVLFCRNIIPAMCEAKRGTVVNVSSLATIYPVPYMSIYNAGKSAFSCFTQSLMLECKESIKIMDLRLGDVKTHFNLKQAKPEEEKWSSKMIKAWHQIEKQLNESPSPEIVAGQILKIISSQKSGVFYRGGFFQSKVAPIVRNFLNHKSLLFLLHHRYHN